MIPKPLKWLIIVLAVVGCGLMIYLRFMGRPAALPWENATVAGSDSKFADVGQGSKSPFGTGRRNSGVSEAIPESDPPSTNISEHQIGGMVEPSLVTAEKLQAYVNKHGAGCG